MEKMKIEYVVDGFTFETLHEAQQYVRIYELSKGLGIDVHTAGAILQNRDKILTIFGVNYDY